MEKNKTGKYLKYAIGEIILVFIGILIALQVNNWNENQTEIKQQNVILANLNLELNNNLKNLNTAIEFSETYINSSENLLLSMNNLTIL
jgi:sensor domain CHASE-containing protein